MERGVKEKFSQNPDLKAFLMATNETKIGESSKTNHFWGTGFHLNDPAAFNSNNWKNNELGRILQEQRESFKN